LASDEPSAHHPARTRAEATGGPDTTGQTSVASRDDLAGWAARLDALGVAHGDIVDASYGSGLSFRDPDNIALELFAPPA
jgi:hypothetical protein